MFPVDTRTSVAAAASSAATKVKKIPLPTSDPWLSSITGRYVWDLTKFPSRFNIYLCPASDTSTSAIALSLLGSSAGVGVKNWPNTARTAALRYCNNYTTFLNGRVATEVTTFEQADIVLCYVTDVQTHLGFYGLTMGPYYLYTSPSSVHNKAWVFINSSLVDRADAFGAGGAGGTLLLHELGHAFGTCHPHDTGAESTVMPGVTTSQEVGLFGQNTLMNTVMTYQWSDLDLPSAFSDWANGGLGYPQTLMPYDYGAMRLMYGMSKTSFPAPFIQSYATTFLKGGETTCFVGVSRDITVPNSVNNVILYLDPPSLQPRLTGQNAGALRNHVIGTSGIMAVDAISSLRDIYLNNTGDAFIYVPSNISQPHTIYIKDSSSAPASLTLYFRSVTGIPATRKTTATAVTTTYRDSISKKAIVVVQQKAGLITTLLANSQRISS